MNQPSVRKNYIYRLLYEMLGLVTPFVTTPYVSRVLGPEGIGINSYTSSIMTFFVLFAALGTTSYGAREIAQHRDNKKEMSKLFWEIELLSVLTTLVCLLVWIVFIIFSTEYRYYYVALIPTLLATMFDISWFFTGREQIKYIVIRNTICKLLGIFMLFVFVKEKSDLFLYMLINSAIVLFGNLSMWTYLPGMVEKTKFKSIHLKKHFHETLIYFIPTIATSLYTVLNKTLIGTITGNSYQNGYYEQANKIIGIVKSFVFVSVNSVMGARISYLFVEKKYNEIHQRIEKSMNFILFLGFGTTFGIIGIARTFVPFFFGEGYEPVVNILYLMAPLILIIGISNCLGNQYFTPVGQRKQSANILVIGSVINVLINLILIPKYEAAGATLGSLIAESFIALLYVYNSNGYMTGKLLLEFSWKRILVGGLMCYIVMKIGDFLPNRPITILVQLLSGAGIYVVGLFIFKDDILSFLYNSVKKIFLEKGSK